MSSNSSFDLPNATAIKADSQKCEDFLNNYNEYGNHIYMQQLQEIANRERVVLDISLDDVLAYKNDLEFVNAIKSNTNRFVYHFQNAADNLIPARRSMYHEPDVYDILVAQRAVLQDNRVDENAALMASSAAPKSLSRRFQVCFRTNFIDKPVELRKITASSIGKLILTKGMVTRVSDVKPLVSVCTYTCDNCGSEIYHEITGNQFMPVTVCPGERCRENKTTGRVQMQSRGSKFVKYQELRIQELPDQVPVGHIPRSISIHCRGELTRKCGPGDVVTITGIFVAEKLTGYKAIRVGLQTETHIEAHHIDKDKKSFEDMRIENMPTNPEYIALFNSPDIYNRLALSIAPEIYGHEDIKKALLLQLIGGVSRNLSDGMKIRGDINICLMGDPGVAKSQLLKYIAKVAPRGVYTTGKGSSGVGLTAAVVRDKLTGDMALEGGSLVLADMGICCIDEFDKMDDSDRTAIHEVMEQQTVSIAKAGITTTLNARTAVLAAANPLFGRYNKRKSISENVNLPNSLLSRFDLMFLIIDRIDIDLDVALSKHVLYVHRYLKNPDKKDSIIPQEAIKQFIAEARKIIPVIPPELTSYIVEAYVSLRSQDASKYEQISKTNDQTVMTPRQLLSVLRLSQALARVRSSAVVSQEDVDEAIRLTHSSKASLLDESTSGSKGEDYISSIFSIIRDKISQSNSGGVNYSNVELMIIKKGFTADQFAKCLEEYSKVGVLFVDDAKTRIELVDVGDF